MRQLAAIAQLVHNRDFVIEKSLTPGLISELAMRRFIVGNTLYRGQALYRYCSPAKRKTCK